MAYIERIVSLTAKIAVEIPDTDDPQVQPDHVERNVANIFYAMTTGSSELDESYLLSDLELEIEVVHPGTTARVALCTSDDPTNHQGNTCPVHETQDDDGFGPNDAVGRAFRASARIDR